MISVTSIPLLWSVLIADSRPFPGPFTYTFTFLKPASKATLETSSAAAQSPFILSAKEMSSGRSLQLESDSIRSGTAFELTTNHGSRMVPAINPQNIEMLLKTQKQIHVTEPVANMFALHDEIIVSGCATSLAGVNGKYVIERINSSIAEDTHYFEVSHADEDIFSSWTDVIFTGSVYSCQVERQGGRILHILTNNQTDGILLDIDS